MDRKSWSAILLLTAALGAAGCYTSIGGPPGDLYSSERSPRDSGYEPPGIEIDPWLLPYYTSSFYVASYGPWGPYYHVPWWWDPGWWVYSYPPIHPSSPIPVATGGRHAWDRGPGAPAPPSVPGSVAPGTPSVSPAVPTKPAENPGQQEEERARGQRDKEEEPKRNAWRR